MANVLLQEAILSQMKFDLNSLNSKPPDEISESYLKAILKDLEETYANSKCLHASLLTSEDCREITDYKKKGIFSQIRSIYHSLWAKIDMLMPSTSQSQSANETLNQTVYNTSSYSDGFSSSGVKLPRLDIPKFSGNYDSWKNFYNLFLSTIHEDRKLKPVQKLQYLLSTVTDSAKEIIQHYSLEDENYELALNALKEEYDHKRMLTNTHLNTLFNLPVLRHDVSADIKAMIHTTRQCLVSLQNLGIDTNSWDPILIFILQQKLPKISHQLWEDKLGKRTDLPKYDEFKEFLEGRFRSLEMIEMKDGTNEKLDKEKVLRSNSNKTTNSKSFHIRSKSNNKNKPFSTKCTLCSGDHILVRCKKFLQSSSEGRYQFVEKHNLCFNCLSASHQYQKCTSSFACRMCNVKHNTLLHDHFINKQDSKSFSQSKQENMPSFQDSGIKTYHIKANSQQVKLLGTAQLFLFNQKGDHIRIRALVDPGSDESYITESTLQTLGIRKYNCPTSISVIGDQSAGECKFRSDFKIASTFNSFSTHLSALVVKTITSRLPTEAVYVDNFDYLQDLDLADPSYNCPGEINMLLGVGIYADIRRNGFRSGGPGKPIAENSELGWIVRGNCEAQLSNFNRPSVSFFTSSNDINADLERFWKLEEVKVTIPQSPEDKLCEEIFLNSVGRCADGRYSVDLPFKNNVKPKLGDSRTIALRRFLNLERKLNSDVQLKTDYHETIRNYLELGHMVPIEELSNDGHEYVMPHHAVFKQSSTTTKTRVVFDASCRTQDGTSLNNHLLSGPKLQLDLRDTLFRWRKYEFVFTADIARMYRQFWINPHHQSYQMIYWRFSETEPIQLFKLTTVTFGTSSAPFLAVRLLQHIADSDLAQQFSLASEALKTEFYVDDLLSGSHNKNIAVKKQQEIRTLLSFFKLVIRKWCSNSEDIIADIPECDREDSNEHEFDDENFRKTLGILWSPSKDCFSFSVSEECCNVPNYTKRNILSIISRVFDPLGLISPCIMYAKNIMKIVWQSNCGWDEEVSQEIKNLLSNFLSQLPKLKTRQIPRWIQTKDEETPITLYGFSDASEIGYGAVVYLKNPRSNATEKLILLTSKTKVAPTNFTSIARLELCAAVLLTNLLEWAQNLFKQEVNIIAFTDSKIVLSWLQDHPSRWKTFVANRTTQILEVTSSDQWHYIDTKSNPADLASRGVLPAELITNDLWWSGPHPDILFHNQFETNCHDEKLIENEKKRSIICLNTVAKSSNDLLERFSSTQKLKSIIKTCSAFISNCLLKVSKRQSNSLIYNSIIERLNSPENVIFRNLQIIFFGEEIQHLVHSEPLNKHSKLISLNPFLDGNNVLRVGGRLHFASGMTYEEKHPIILPSRHQITTNLIIEAHEITMHGNSKETMAYLRQKFYFFRMNDRIKYYIRNCTRCFRFQKQLKTELMGSLPPPRVNINRPFLHVGVDYAGPFSVKVWRGKIKSFYKAYLAIFICLSTKAIHIELISDLSTDGFLAAFKRITSRRGRIIKMYSDQGTNFVGASKELIKEFELAQLHWQEELQSQLSTLGTSWFFIPPASPHFGGLWEAGVKSIKAHLYRITKDVKFTFEELNTLLVQIEGVLNSRPLCKMSDNVNDYCALSPSHFLIGESIISPPERDFSLSKISCLKRWHLLQKMFQQFWHSWSTDYLHTMQQRTKWKTQQEKPFKINDLVLVTHENYPPSLWPTARIIELHTGQDGLNRVVSVRYSDGRIKKRPITKLILVPVAQDISLN